MWAMMEKLRMVLVCVLILALYRWCMAADRAARAPSRARCASARAHLARSRIGKIPMFWRDREPGAHELTHTDPGGMTCLALASFAHTHWETLRGRRIRGNGA